MKCTLSFFIPAFLFALNTQSQVLIDSVSLISHEEVNTQFCFNNTKLMGGSHVSDRYLVYYNPDTIFLNVFQAGIWDRKVAYTGSNIQSATLSFHRDTVWLCWKEGVISSQIKASFTPDTGNSWVTIPPVSPVGKVAAPSVYASSNGKVHFVWYDQSPADTIVFHRAFYNGTYLTSAYPLSNASAQGEWPSVIAVGDTVLSAWKEAPLPTKVWYRSSFDGGVSWNPLSSSPTTSLLPLSKDPNLAYAYDSVSHTHYVYLAYDSQNKIYLQRSTDFGNTWNAPDTISNTGKLSQFAHIECNENGFVGVAYEQRPPGTSLFDETKKDVGFTYSTNWGSAGSFSVDTLAYTHNGFGAAYPAFSKIDENNFYLAWLTKDTINNFMNIYERRIYFGSAAGIKEPAETDYVLVAPNPFSSQTILHSGRPLTNATLTLKNCSGQTVRIIEHINGKEIALYRHDLPAGLYFICLADSHFLLSGKLAITD